MIQKNSEISISRDDGRLLVRIFGEIDHHNAPIIRERIDACIDEGNLKELAIDMSAVSFMDSSGLGLILGRYKKASLCGCKLTVVDPSARVEKIFNMAGLGRIIKIERKNNNERKTQEG